MNKPFEPSWWCRNAHAQTILGTLFRFPPRLSFRREIFETSDGDFLHLDILKNKSDSHSLPVLFILHGLEGSSQASYVLTLAEEAGKAGWDCVLVNMRMCSGEPNRLPSTYHSGKTEDLDAIIRAYRTRERHRPFCAAGFSIGGNILLKWLGEQGAEAGIEKAAAISVPYDLTQSVQLLDKGFNKHIYTRSLLRSLKRKVRMKALLWPDHYPLKPILKSQTFTEFDRLVTAPLNGFRDEKEYWRCSSSRFYLERIQKPCLLVHAADDPFFPAEYLPYKEISRSASLKLLRTDHGGHLGFLGGSIPWKPERWLEETVIHFLQD